MRSALLLALPLTLAAQIKPRIDTLPGKIIRVTSNGPTEWKDGAGWRLVLERTIQMKEDTPDPTNDIRDMVLLDDGRVVVSERKPVRLRIFPAGGGAPITIAREGGGPGEVVEAFLGRNGDTLLIRDRARLTAMLPNGKTVFAIPLALSSLTTYETKLDSRGRVMIKIIGRVNQSGVTREQTGWIRFDRTGKVIDSIGPLLDLKMSFWKKPPPNPRNTQYSVPLSAESGYELLHDGRLVLGRTDRNEFIISRTGQDTQMVFRRTDAVPVPVTARVRDSIFDWYQERQPGMPRKADISTVWPLWRFMNEDGRGNLWVRHERDAFFDVYAPDGAFRGVVAAPFTNTLSASWASDRVATYSNDEDGFPRIMIYRIERNR